MQNLINLDNGLYASSYIVVKNIIKDILSTIGDGKISYDLFKRNINDKNIKLVDNKIILSESHDYNYHTNVYKDWKDTVYSEDPKDVEKFTTCICLKTLYNI